MTAHPKAVVKVVELETERLRLRGHRQGDLEDSAAMWGDPEVTKYVGGKPLTREEVWRRLLGYVGHWAWMGYGLWAVEEKATGRFAGEVGYGCYQRDIVPALADSPELGWVLATEFQGKGYATEAVRAAMAWGDQRFGGQQTICIIHPENTRSIHVAQKCGFTESATAFYKGEPTVVFKR